MHIDLFLRLPVLCVGRDSLRSIAHSEGDISAKSTAEPELCEFLLANGDGAAEGWSDTDDDASGVMLPDGPAATAMRENARALLAANETSPGTLGVGGSILGTTTALGAATPASEPPASEPPALDLIATATNITFRFSPLLSDPDTDDAESDDAESADEDADASPLATRAPQTASGVASLVETNAAQRAAHRREKRARQKQEKAAQLLQASEAAAQLQACWRGLRARREQHEAKAETEAVLRAERAKLQAARRSQPPPATGGGTLLGWLCVFLCSLSPFQAAGAVPAAAPPGSLGAFDWPGFGTRGWLRRRRPRAAAVAPAPPSGEPPPPSPPPSPSQSQHSPLLQTSAEVVAAMQNMPPGSLIDGHPVHKLFSVAARDDCDHSALTAVLSSIAGSEVLQRVVFSTSASADAYRQSNPDKTAWSLERSPKAVPAPEDAVVQQTPYLVLRAASLLDASAPELRRLLLPMFGQSVVVRSWQDAHAYRQSSPDQGRIYALDGFVDADGAYGGGLRIDTDVARLGGVCFGDGCVQQTDDTSSETTEAAAEKDIVSIQPLPPRVKLAAQHDLTSEYFETYLSAETDPTLSEVWDWALHVPYQYYTMNRQKNSLSGGWRKIQPKAEFWVTIEQDGQKQRPVYYWKEGTDFYHAGYEIVQGTVVRRLLDKINHDFGLEGRNKINSLMLIIDDQGWHHAPPHADGHRTGGFFDISLGYSRDVQLLKPDTPAEWDKVTASHVLASQGTANGSLLRVTPHDNGFRGEDGTTRLPKAKHGVPPDTEQDRQLARVLDSLSQLSDDDLKARLLALTRISIVGRAITSRSDGLQKGEHFRPIDDKAAARVREGGAKWKPYKPLFFRSREVSFSHTRFLPCCLPTLHAHVRRSFGPAASQSNWRRSRKRRRRRRTRARRQPRTPASLPSPLPPPPPTATPPPLWVGRARSCPRGRCRLGKRTRPSSRTTNASPRSAA